MLNVSHRHATRVILTLPESEAYLPLGARSDSQGHFAFKNIAARKYWAHAQKEEDGYPDTSFAFWGIDQPHPKEVTVMDGTTTTVEISVGQPDGRLTAIVEDESGHPVVGAQYRLIPVQNPELDLLSGANIRGEIDTLVPGVPITLQMEAAGFRIWRSAPILIKSGENKRLEIKLVPLAKTPRTQPSVGTSADAAR